MNLIKRIFIIFIIFFIIFFSLYGIGILYGRVRTSYLINWHVTFPKPSKEEIIFSAGWSDSVYSDVLYYDNNNYIKKMNKLTKINDKNIEFIRNKFDSYLYFVDGFGKEYIELLNNKIDFSTLLNEDNYYFYKQDKKLKNRFLIVIADTKENLLYLFVSNC